MPRHYFRHPAEIPIILHPIGSSIDLIHFSHDLSEGGLSCDSHYYIDPGSHIEITVKIDIPAIKVIGHVIWCRENKKHYLLGIGFDNSEHAFTMRMVQQACQIECYRRKQRSDGRFISADQAAQEWITKYASDFPDFYLSGSIER